MLEKLQAWDLNKSIHCFILAKKYYFLYFNKTWQKSFRAENLIRNQSQKLDVFIVLAHICFQDIIGISLYSQIHGPCCETKTIQLCSHQSLQWDCTFVQPDQFLLANYAIYERQCIYEQREMNTLISLNQYAG